MCRTWRWGALVVLLIGLQGGSSELAARVLVTQEEALDRAFPSPQTRQRHTLYLDVGEAKRVEALAGSAPQRAVVPYYVGMLEGRITGYAYFDTHIVRTLQETVVVRLSPGGRIEAIEVISFDEPEDYLPRERWLHQFDGHRLDDGLSLKGEIRALTGATLSSRAVTAAVRRILAIHALFVAKTPAGAGQDRSEAPE
jgi:uncharacterized protein with FMN-binding domain